MFCNVERIAFAHTRKISNCCRKNLKFTAILNPAARKIIFELKEFSQVGTQEFDTIASKLHPTALLIAWAQLSWKPLG